MARVEIEKVDGKEDFALWKAKTKAHKVILDPSELPTTLTR